ncbi:MAG: Tad domain-containing protein [Candidatus Dormibacteraeota bacterium]|nr:Tad domain-containing protein [Candidatus Dormibacteraeota bacterium]
MTRSRRRGQHGQAIVIVAAMMAVLLGFVGLAIDSARLIDARRVLQDSVDAGALAAAESFQAGRGWSVSQTNAVALFEIDNRLAPGESCSPVFSQPAPGTPVTVTCTMAGGYSLALTAADNGPAGQSFSLSASHSVSAALMQAIGQFGSLVVQAGAAATANDLALTPAIAGFASNNCYGTPGIDPVQLSGSSTITGDAVSNGSFVVPVGSAPVMAGNVLTRCGPPTNGGNIGYRCWRSGASSPCPANNTLGRLLSTNSRLADPRFTVPPSGSTTAAPGTSVVLTPGKYTTDPQFGSIGPCYFLPPGVYEWQAGLTVNSGIVSNQLRPPAEPGPKQFWKSNGVNCAGDFTLSPKASSENGLNGTFAVIVTSVRVDGSATRESAPSLCKPTPPLDSNTGLAVLISNVPGATSYNLYTTAAGGTCAAGPFHRFGSISSNAAAQKNDATSGCPGTTIPTSCSLGVSPASSPMVFDSTNFPSSGAAPPDSEVANTFGGSLPNQSAPRTQAPAGTSKGDLANENSCVDSSGTPAYCRAAITPGAVLMKVTGTGCINVKNTPGGDLHIFSGYQYDWVVVHEPATTTCTNTWSGKTNSAAIGLVYAPGAAFNLDSPAALTAPTGGVLAGTVSVNNSVVTYDPAYAPLPPATRLTG